MKTMKKVLSAIVIMCTIVTSFVTNFYSVKASIIKDVIILNKSIQNPKEMENLIRQYYPENVQTIGELEYLEELNSMSEAQLIKKGASNELIQKVKSNGFSKDLLNLSKYTNIQLKERGYNQKQIKAIRNYKPNQNAIDYASTYSLSSAVVTCGFGPTLNTNTRQMDIFYWASWNEAPIFCFDDVIGIAFVGADSASHPLAMKVDSIQAEGWYFAGGRKVFSRTLPSKQYTGYINTIIDMDFNISDIHNYCEYAYGNVKISTQSNSYNLYSTNIRMTYGHTILDIGAPKISYNFVSNSLSIVSNVSLRMQTEYDEEVTYLYNLLPAF